MLRAYTHGWVAMKTLALVRAAMAVACCSRPAYSSLSVSAVAGRSTARQRRTGIAGVDWHST